MELFSSHSLSRFNQNYYKPEPKLEDNDNNEEEEIDRSLKDIENLVP